jgi:acyl carrier protein
MTRDEIAQRVTSAMCEMFELSASAVHPAAELQKDLGLDSIDAVDLSVKFQELTGRKVPLSDLIRIRTVSDVVDVVEKHMRAADA